MRATLIHGDRDIRSGQVEAPKILSETDALVRVVAVYAAMAGRRSITTLLR